MIKKRKIGLVVNDPWLEPQETEIVRRYQNFKTTLEEIKRNSGSLSEFANAYHYFGIHWDRLKKGWYYREWAQKLSHRIFDLFGDFNDWKQYSHRLTKVKDGIWELFLDGKTYKDRFIHESRVKVMVHSDQGFQERIPSYIRRIIQDKDNVGFSGRYGFRLQRSTGRRPVLISPGWKGTDL